MPRSFWVETLGCPKNQVDSDKLTGHVLADGLVPAGDRRTARISWWSTPVPSWRRPARSRVATVLDLDERRGDGSELVVTGCMAERYGDELGRGAAGGRLVAGFGSGRTARRDRTGAA